MSTTFQKILKPTKYRALDTSTSLQLTGIDVINDGGFATDVAESTTGTYWITGDDCVISSGSATWTNDSGDSSGNCTQTNLAHPLENGATYRVTFTLSGFNQHGGSGGFRVKLHADAGTVAIGTTRKGNDTYVEDLTIGLGSGTAANQVIIQTYGDPMSGTIDNISVEKLESFANNNHGQIYSGRGLEFDGLSDRFSVPLTADVTSFTAGEPWTWACWMKFDVNNSTDLFVGNDGSSHPHLFVYADGALGFRDSTGNADYFRPSTDSIQTNTWYRVVYVASSSNTLKIYLNGQQYGNEITASTAAFNGAADYASRTFSTTAIKFTGWGGPYASGGNRGHYFPGKMSDAQIWDTAWTQSDVTYDYLNPESLVLNNSGTSLTEYNLKLWYPMQDGHRATSTQVVDGTNVASYIFDGANTGLGPELYTTDNILSTTNETNAMTGITVVEGGQTVSGTISSDTSTGNYALDFNSTVNSDGFYIDLNDYCTDGKQYAIKVVAKSGDASLSGGFFRIADNPSLSSTHAVPDYNAYVNSQTHTDYQTYTIYFTHQTDGSASDNPATLTRYFGFRETSSQNTVRLIVDSISIRAIGEKHNATTEFLGEDLFDVGVGDYSDSTGGWTAEANNIVDNNDSALRITFVDDDDGARLNLNDAANLKEDLVVGRTYQIVFEYKINQVTGSSVPLQINQGDSSTFTNVTLNQTSFTEVTRTFTCLGSSPAIKLNNMDSGDIVHLKNFTLKEVGVATGWTEADKQLDIPQTALQSYNQLVFYDGNDNYHQTSSSITLGDNTSISFWAYINEGSTSDSFSLIRTGVYGDENFRIIAQTDQIVVTTSNEDETTTQENHNFTTTFELGKWHHIAAYIPRQAGNSVVLYHNGVKLTTDAMARDMKVAAHNWMIGLGYGITHQYLQGAITEISYFNAELTDKEFWELYNDRKPLNALHHSKESQLVHYWRNEGIGDWSDNKGSNTLTPNGSPEETLLLPAGVDASRDTQGLIMNRQKTTNTLNLPMIGFTSSGNMLGSSNIEVHGNTITDYTSTDFSFDCWINTPISGKAMFVATHQEATNSGEGWHLRRTTANTLNFTIADHDGDTVSSGANAVLSANRWYHVVCCWDSSADKKLLYIDGELKQIQTGSNIGTITPNATLHIGQRRDNTSQEWVGNIDDVKIYNRLLSDGGVSSGVSDSNNLSLAAGGEIKRNYNAGKRSHR